MIKFNRVIRSGVAGVLVTGALVVSSGSAGAHPAIDRQIADLTARMAAAPADATLYVRRGELHRIHRDWALAEADYSTAQGLDPDLPEVTLGLGLLQVDAGKPAEAVVTLNRFLSSRPTHSAGLAARGRAKVELKQFASAADDFTAALEHLGNGPGQPSYYLERARALVAASEENIGRALSGLDQGLEQLGQPVTLQLLAIEYELRLQRTDAALARLEKIASQSGRKETWHLRRAEILELAGRVDDARRSYGEALEAIASLPRGRRDNRAVKRLESAAREGLERLRPAAEPGTDG